RERKARSRFPASDPCTRCGESNWQFVSLSPNERSALWKCGNSFCGKKVIIRKRTKLVKNSRHIPKEVQREVWRRDQRRCVQCGATEKLEFDHIIPVAKGGAS